MYILEFYVHLYETNIIRTVNFKQTYQNKKPKVLLKLAYLCNLRVE